MLWPNNASIQLRAPDAAIFMLTQPMLWFSSVFAAESEILEATSNDANR